MRDIEFIVIDKINQCSAVQRIIRSAANMGGKLTKDDKANIVVKMLRDDESVEPMLYFLAETLKNENLVDGPNSMIEVFDPVKVVETYQQELEHAGEFEKIETLYGIAKKYRR